MQARYRLSYIVIKDFYLSKKCLSRALGCGTRFPSATQITPEEMPIALTKSLIPYSIAEALKDGIATKSIVTRQNKRITEDRFGISCELGHQIIRVLRLPFYQKIQEQDPISHLKPMKALLGYRK